MKIRVAAGAAALHACSTLTGQELLTREGGLLAFTVEDLDENDTLGALKAADDTIGEAILATENEALIAGLTDLRVLVLGMERDIRVHFAMAAAVRGDATVTDTGSQPTSVDDSSISNVSTQSSDTTQIEEHHSEAQQVEPDQRPRRRGRS